MAKISQALSQLGITDWVVRGQPTDSDEFVSMFKKVIGTESDGTAIESSDPSLFGVTWAQVSAKLTELQNAEPMKLLRVERNDKLAETDWWASSDLTITDEQKKYRQDLRDITKSATSLDDVKWPTKP